jgi:hypothetical protein
MPIEHQNLLEYLADRERRIRNNAINSKWLGRSFVVWVVMLMLILLLAVRRVAYDDSAYVLFVFFIISLVFIAFNTYWRKRNCTDDEMEAIISAAENDLHPLIEFGIELDVNTDHEIAAIRFNKFMLSLGTSHEVIVEYERGNPSLKLNHGYGLLKREMEYASDVAKKFGLGNSWEVYFPCITNPI